jgi:two-component system phosphate regulon sensor histidine kinase PhoR
VRRRPLFRFLFPAWGALLLVLLGGIYWLVSRDLTRVFWGERTEDLRGQAGLLAHEVAPLLAAGDAARVEARVREMGALSGIRFTVILADGRVAGDSDFPRGGMENHYDRPEFKEAMAGRTGVTTRRSPTMGQNTIYVAVPIALPDGKTAVARAAAGMEGLAGGLRALRMQFLAGTLLALLFASAVGFIAARRIVLPLREMTEGAEKFSRAEFAARLPLHRVKEIDALADALNRMAEALGGRLDAVTRRKDELEAVLTSMVEGVLAVDPRERILSFNPSAAVLLRLSQGQSAGRTLQEAVRNSELHDIVARTLGRGIPVEGEITLAESGSERCLQVSGAPLRDGKGAVIGALLVFNDITSLRRLEDMRRDFVANVSHEVRTPITSIKGAVETLLEGARDDPQATDRFLRMIARHADRLHSLVEDLLRLSRIEREGERGEIVLSSGPLCDILREAVEAVRPLADQRKTPIEVCCPEGVAVRRDPFLLAQAVVNLIDNAVKYSGEGSPVRVSAREVAGGVEIEVRDQGCGIAPEHLPRLFERFYRADPARSRKLGGTGLGLAIVKHIVSAHRGIVSVESAPGKGSAFTIRIPA